MIKFFSWLIVFAIALYFLGTLTFFISPNLIPMVMLFSFGLGGLSALAIIILLVKERIEDREVEKDDLSKY